MRLEHLLSGARMPFRGGFLSVSVYLLCLPFLFLSVPSRATESYSSVGQSATLIMWRSAVQVCLGLLRGGLAQLARAPALQAGGQRFESVILHLPFFGHRSLTCCHTKSRLRSRGCAFCDALPQSPKYDLHCAASAKGAWRMPWLTEAMKDAISCDKPRLGANDP